MCLECALALYAEALIKPGHIDWMRLIELMSATPAKIVRLDRGTLREGATADVTIIDPDREWNIDVASFVGKSRNCPFGGWKVKGRAVTTIVGGEVKWALEQ